MKRLLLVGLAAALTLAAQKVDFSGTWEIVKDKSDFGRMPPPDKMTRTIAHQNPELKMTTVVVGQFGEFKSEYVYRTDGKETKNKSRMGESTSTAKLEGRKLIVASKLEGNFQGNAFTATSDEVWELSEDGKTLTATMTSKSERGEFTQKAVFAKQ
jgi:hypothetical protein